MENTIDQARKTTATQTEKFLTEHPNTFDCLHEVAYASKRVIEAWESRMDKAAYGLLNTKTLYKKGLGTVYRTDAAAAIDAKTVFAALRSGV